MKTILITTAASLIAIAAPAQAQLLGGGGGLLGGSPVPTLPVLPSLPATVPAAPVGTVTNATAGGNGSATVSKSADTRTGKANASGSANGSATGSLTQAIDTPVNSATAGLTGSANGSGSANADAQLIGTDAARSIVKQTRDSAGNTVTTYRDRAGGLITTTRDRAGNLLATSGQAAGSAQGSASGSGNGAFNGLGQNLALAGSAAAAAAGTFDVKSGTSLFDLQGERIGKVSEVFADGSGRVKGLLVKTADGTALLPVQDFAANGETLVTTLSQSQIAATGAGQADGTADGSTTGIFSGLSHNLALAGSVAGNAAGSFDVKAGTKLFDMTGEKIGKVKEVVADANGRVQALVVKVKDSTATLPAANFAANGDMLVTVMSQAQITSAASQQAAGSSATNN
jgi:sporulation protein YlmC with PRC-barrel domain